MEEKELIESLVVNRKDIESILRRLDAVEDTTKLIYDINRNIAVMVSKMGTQEEKLDSACGEIKSIKKDVEDVKLQPAKKWDKATWLVICTTIGTVLGYFFRVFIK